MRIQIAVGVVSSLMAVTAAAAPSSGAPQPSASTGLAFLRASELSPPRGGASRAPHGYVPLHADALAQAKAAANSRAGLHAGTATPSVGAGGPTVTSYPNVSPSFDADYETGLTPPDTTGAIGPDRYIEVVNTQFAIYDRTGSLMGGGTLSALTNVPTGLFGYALSDPQMMWDAKTQRFYYSAVYYDSLFLSDNGLAVGWSKTATPSSAADFCQYAISFGGELPDYPKLGDSPDFLLYGYNRFGNAGQTYDGSAFAMLNKPPAGATCPPESNFVVTGSGTLFNADGSEAATPVPANLVDDSTGAGYVVANADLTTTPSANFVSVYTVRTNGVDSSGIPIPSVSGPTNVTVPSYSIPSSAAQQGSSNLIDTLDGRFEAAVAAVDPGHGNTVAVWTAHSVFGGAGAEERWYELDPGAGSLLQSGSVSSPSLFVWNGAVSPDRASNGTSGSFGDSMAMSVSTSSATSYPAIQFVWKQGAGGAQSALTNLVQSSGADVDFSCSSTTPCRWGDYSGASPDPAATGSVGKVWLGNQYNLAGGSTSSTAWRTWLFAVTPTGGAPPPPPGTLSFATGPQTLTAGQPSGAMQLTLTPAQAADATVTLSSSSAQGRFATSAGGPWSATLPLTIAGSQTTSPSFYYLDTQAGTPTLTVSGSGLTGATQGETVAAAPLATITVSPASATVGALGTQAFSATGADAFGNPVSVAGATWSTDVAGGSSVSPTTGATTTFTAGSTSATGSVTASVGAVGKSASVTVTAAPPAPTGLVATAQKGRIVLSWNGSGSGVTYRVYRGTSPGGESSTPYATGVTGTAFNDSSVTSRTTYYYEVTAVSGGGESPRSNEAHARAR
jgi:hypothetical protein